MPSNNAYRFLLIDDDALAREVIITVISKYYFNTIVTSVNSFEEAIDQLSLGSWDLIILDLSLGKKSGLTVISETRNRDTTTPILVLSSHPELEAALPCLKAGANGFLNKDQAVTSDLLYLAISKILSGDKYLSKALLENLIQLASDAKSNLNSSLSTQEAKVLFFIARGNSAKEIAHLMQLNEKSVRTYRARLLEKLDLKSDAEIVRYAIQHSIID